MKRVGLILFGAVVAVVLTAPIYVATAGTSTPPPASTAGNDPIAKGDPVCVSLPIDKTSTQGRCPAGQFEVPNVPNTGGAIIAYTKQVLKLLNGVVGGVILLIFVIAGVTYITSAGEPANVKKAKNMVTQAVIGLVLYLMMFAIVNFLIPGGVFS